MSKKPNLFRAFEDAMRSVGIDGSRKEAFGRFLDTVRSNPAYLEQLADEYFHQKEAQWRIGPHGGLEATPAKQRRAEVSAEAREERADRVAQTRAALAETIRPFIWLEMTMPNGKKLRHCTGAELAQFGGAFLAMSKHLKPSQVVDKHLSETDLRNIASRFKSGGKRRGGSAEMHA